MRVDHGPVPTFAYRIDFQGRSIVFSGDDRKSANLIAKAQNVEVASGNEILAAQQGERLRTSKR